MALITMKTNNNFLYLKHYSLDCNEEDAIRFASETFLQLTVAITRKIGASSAAEFERTTAVLKRMADDLEEMPATKNTMSYN
jgi:hypothetical protein